MGERDPYEAEKVQMYNLGGEYPDLPSRLLAWPDYCTQVERANVAEAARDAAEAERDEWKQDAEDFSAIDALREARAQRDRLAAALRRIADIDADVDLWDDLRAGRSIDQSAIPPDATVHASEVLSRAKKIAREALSVLDQETPDSV